MSLDIFGTTSLDEAARRDLIRKELLNLTTSYSDEADIFAELVQNAVDAITMRPVAAQDDKGKLTIVIGRRKNNAHYFYVQDNGVGMDPDIVEKVFIPSFSYGKSQGKSIGYKGVGLSYVVAVSDHLAIRTRSDSATTERTIRYTNGWVTDSEKPQPAVTAEFDVPEVVAKVAETIGKTGTGVYFAFHPGSDPRTLDNIVYVDSATKELRSWAAFLCARTPVGLALAEGAEPATPMDVRIVLDRGDVIDEATFERSRYNLSEGTVGYPFPETVFRVGINTAEIDKTPMAQMIFRHERKHQAIFHEWSAQELVDEIELLDDDDRALLASHLVWVRGYLCYSTDVLKKVREEMGTRAAVVRYGAKLAVDGAPQGRPVELALTSDQGLDRQTHIVLGFSELGLDTGRKIVSDERITRAINRVTQRVVTKLKDYRWALKVKDKAPVASDLTKWVSDINARAGNSIIPELFKNLSCVPPARVDPDNEQEVIALWTALVTTGTLPGYSMRAISGFNRYDALMDIESDAMKNNGALAAIAADFHPKKNAVLEFKWSFDSLITDFEQKVKLPQEIDLVVCWDCGDLNMRVGGLVPTYAKWSHERRLRAASYNWSDDSGAIQFPVIALRNVIAELLVERGVNLGKPLLDILVNRDSEKHV